MSYCLWYHIPDESSSFDYSSFKVVCNFTTKEDVDIIFKYFTKEWFSKGFYIVTKTDCSPVLEDNRNSNSISFISFMQNRNTNEESAYMLWRSLMYNLVNKTLLNNKYTSDNVIAIKSTPKSSKKVTFNIWINSDIYAYDCREIISHSFHRFNLKHMVFIKGNPNPYRFSNNDVKINRSNEMKRMYKN